MTTKQRLRSQPPQDGDFVRLSRRDAEDALRLLQIFSRALIGNFPASIDRAHFVRIARRMLEQRQERCRQLPAEMFGELAWIILLELYVRGPLSEAELGNVAEDNGVPASAADRWVGFLHEQDLVCSRTEAAMEMLQLTPKARRILDSYFCHLLTADPH